MEQPAPVAASDISLTEIQSEPSSPLTHTVGKESMTPLKSPQEEAEENLRKDLEKTIARLESQLLVVDDQQQKYKQDGDTRERDEAAAQEKDQNDEIAAAQQEKE
jgi:hypothetical protein